MVIADDHVWHEYIKAHTEARQYMTRPVPYYGDLCLICGGSNNDEGDNICYHSSETIDEVPEATIGTVDRSSAASGSGYDQFYNENESSPSGISNTGSRMIKRQLEISQMVEYLKKSRNEDEGMVHAIQETATAVPSSMYKGIANGNLNDVPTEHVVAAIQSLPDMDEDLVLDACDLLEDEKKAKTFLALDIKLRKKWLIRKLRPTQ